MKLCLLLLPATLIGLSVSLEIARSGSDSVEAMQGSSVTLDCKFTISPQENVATLDIEWMFIAPGKQGELIATYTGGRAYTQLAAWLSGRLAFTALDPASGDASVSLAGVSTPDAGHYACRLKLMPSTATRTLTLAVNAVPSGTACTLKGSPLVGEDLELMCSSVDGTQPITYTWTYIGTHSMPAIAKQDTQRGSLSLRNASLAFSGSYLCSAINAVGSDSCSYQLRLHGETSVGPVVAAVLCPLLVIAIVAVFIVVCVRRRRTASRKEKELSHVIRMDESPPPPSSRSHSRASRPLTSQAGSRPLTSQAGSRPLSSQGGSRPLTSVAGSRAGSGPGSYIGSQVQPMLKSPPPYDDSPAMDPILYTKEVEEEVEEEEEVVDGIDPLDHHHPPKQRGFLV